MKWNAKEKSTVRLLFVAALLLLLVLNASTAWGILGALWGIMSPIVLGCILAFVLNIPMKALERVFFPNSQRPLVRKMRRPACFVLSLIIIAAIFVLVIALVVPQLVNALVMLARESIVLLANLRTWAAEHSDQLSQLAAYLPDPSQTNEDELKGKVTQFLSQGALGLVGAVSRATGFVVDFSFGLIFAIYVLMGKETLARQATLVGTRYASETFVNKAHHALSIARKKFEQFIVGQCLEAGILGVLCTIGMLALQLPYAPTVGALIAATSLIPIVGAYIGGALAAFLIFSVSPMQAVVFLVFLVLLQQFEGNVIYPRTVGNAIALPGLWVTAAVTIGAGMAGIPGMLVGVPLAATVYDLVKEDVTKGLPPEAGPSSEAEPSPPSHSSSKACSSS